MQIRKIYLVPAVLILAVGVILGMQIDLANSSDDVRQNGMKIQEAFYLISKQYVDDVDTGRVAEYSIEGMLKQLDPHSIYIDAEDMKEVQDEYRGEFGGIGIWFQIMNDTARVVSTISGGPSEEAGVLAGDRIISVDGTEVVGETNLQKYLKGPVGTDVLVTMQRLGEDEPIDISIRRDKIRLVSIDSAYMLDDETGYIHIERFSAKTHEEFVEAVQRLRADGMEQLMIDLRNNGGGVMQSALAMVNEMVDGGKVIVSTRSRIAEYNDRVVSNERGMLKNMPVIVMVNGSSASASEIVSGALQDHDRALIVGRRTFGKGLVQKPFSLSDGSVLQMTISRYYTPSGRLIQTPYEDGDKEDYYKEKFESLQSTYFSLDEYKESIPDSLQYETSHGRTVYGGGGILPDFFLPLDTTVAPVMRALNRRATYIRYVREFFDKDEQGLRDRWGDRKDDFATAYAISDDMWNGFWAYAAEEDEITVTTDDAMVNAEENIFPMAQVTENRALIETYLTAYMAGRLYGQEASIPIFNSVDDELESAQRFWDEARDLAETYHMAGNY
ncbi:MAG: S41 family peptidase [Bacteroidota bacterium]